MQSARWSKGRTLQRLDASEPGFAAAFAQLVDARWDSDADVAADVAAIIADVRARGDTAVAELTARFDGVDLDASGWEIPLINYRSPTAF